MEHSADTVLIYTARQTPRLAYIVAELFPLAAFTSSKETFTAYLGAKICYAETRFCNNTLWMVPSGLLEQEGIHAQEISMGDWRKRKTIFQTPGDLPFDLFAAAFYLLSRYEEYLPHEKDTYGRYAHTNSIAYKEGFLASPLVNEWMYLLAIELRERCSMPKFRIEHGAFSFVPTYDVDEAFSYQHKPTWKNVLGFFRDLLAGNFEQVVERGNVYTGKKPDPYYTFDWIESVHARYQLKPIWFFLTILRRGTYDKNLPAKSKPLQQLYKQLAAANEAGLHPSWQSGDEEWLLEKERDTLERMIEKPVQRSRQHYLRFNLPHTYRRLIDAGIRHDYSMAYGNVNGFRASYTRPFHWYDLEKEEVTDLIIHPFCFMEATSFFNQSYSVEEAAAELQRFHDVVKKVNGEFIILFHNHFLTEQPQWVQWREMYAAFLQKNFG